MGAAAAATPAAAGAAAAAAARAAAVAAAADPRILLASFRGLKGREAEYWWLASLAC